MQLDSLQVLSKTKQLIKTIGPGILFAGAAIGGSHLIQSTRAGATFGFELIPIVILANLMKYPFFQFGHRYIAAKKENLLHGYKSLGNWAIYTFFFMNLVLSFANAAAVLIITSGLFEFFLVENFGIAVESLTITLILTIVFVGILLIGKYALMDILMKVLIATLSVATIVAFFVAFGNGMQSTVGYEPMPLFTKASLMFIIALMGWMPAPIEASVWNSLWVEERIKQTNFRPTLKQSLVDFNLGYIITAVLALFFLGLGAFVMFGSGVEFAVSGIGFSAQLISLYTTTLGTWLLPVITLVALITMVSTTITVFDAYPRSLAATTKIAFNLNIKDNINYWGWLTFTVVLALFMITLFSNQMRHLVDFATTISFLASAFFAVINLKAVTSKDFPEYAKPKGFLLWLSYAGLVFLWGFSFLYLYYLIF
jgi:Mn2+/Fe2+ NRAMP family transporter